MPNSPQLHPAVLPPWPAPWCAGACLLPNFAHTAGLKHRPLTDVNCVAGGFVLRLLAGIWVPGDTPTVWNALCTYTLALLLATALRPVLLACTLPFLDSLINSAAPEPIVCYAAMRCKLPTIVRGQAGEPEKIVLKDKGIQAGLILRVLFYLATTHGDVRLFR